MVGLLEKPFKEPFEEACQTGSNHVLEDLKLIKKIQSLKKSTMLVMNHNTSLCRDMHHIFFVSVISG